MKRLIKNRFPGILAAAVVLLVISSGTFMAQDKDRMGHGKMDQDKMEHGKMMHENMGLFKDLRNDIHGFIKTNVVPDLKSWKNELDKSMTAEDLGRLNTLRSRAADLRKEMKDKMKSMMADRQQGADKDAKKDNKDAMKDTHEKMKALAQELKPIAEKYKASLKTIGDQAKPRIETWKKDVMNMVDKWKDTHKTEIKDLQDKTGMDFDKMHQKMMGRMLGFGKDGMDQKRLVARFMLWNGSDDFLDEMGMMNDSDDSRMKVSSVEGSSETKDVRNYPNPFSDKTTIYFSNPKTQHVTVTVSDSRGNVVSTLFDGEMKEGDNSVVFDPSGDLSVGTYFYKITAGSMSKSGKMVYNK